MISSAGRGFPQWVELHCDDMDRLHPPLPLPAFASGGVWAATGQSRQDCRRQSWVVKIVISGCLCQETIAERILTLPTIQPKFVIIIASRTLTTSDQLTTSLRYRIFRRGSRISARGGRQGIDDLIWDGDE